MILSIHEFGALTFARYEFRLDSLSEGFLPAYMGSPLRGAFGRWLKEIVCAVEGGDCSRCLLFDRCLYPGIFEPIAKRPNGLLKHGQSAPRPYLFEPVKHHSAGLTHQKPSREWRYAPVTVRPGDRIGFKFLLIGEAIKELPYFVFAMDLMARHGFEDPRARGKFLKFQLTEARAVNASGEAAKIFDATMSRIVPHNAEQTLASFVLERMRQLEIGRPVRLRFLSPMRIRAHGSPLERPDMESLVKSLSLRLRLLTQCYGDGILTYDYGALMSVAKRVAISMDDTCYHPLERYSFRQREELPMDGFTGDCVVQGPELYELLPLLLAGEIIHAGSNTVFGLGQFMVLAATDLTRVSSG